MSLLTPAQMRAIQSMGQKAMQTDVTILRKLGIQTDSENPYGDDTVAFEPASSSVTVKGWMVPQLGKNFDVDQGKVQAFGDHIIRVPVGTVIEPEDEVIIGGEVYVVIDSNTEQTWPEWTTAVLRRIQ